jgi:hypothetical protein
MSVGGATTAPMSRQRRAALSRKQMAFVQEYAHIGNGAEAARKAGYKAHSAKQIANENLTKPYLAAAVKREMARIAADVTPERVKARLHEISIASQSAGQFGPAVRAEELLGKSIGMWIDQSIALSGQLKDEHIQALIEIARRRQAEPVELQDDGPHNQTTHDDIEDR